MSGFKSYPEYKDSGVDWLGDVPAHWDVLPLKYLAMICNGRDYKDVEQLDGPYPVLGSGGEFARASHYLYEGQSVLLGRKGTVDKPLFVQGRFWTVDTMFYTAVFGSTDPRFLFYCSLPIPFQYYSTNTALPSMTQEALGNHVLAAPDRVEQSLIARFLDHETAKIDALIAEQQRLIELLQEKRQAVISHAVTKGLNPDAPMKDSGVEWLGEVPAHWDISQSKHLFQYVTSGSRGWAEYYSETGPLFFRIANLHRNSIEPKTGPEHIQRVLPPIGSEGTRAQVKEGDILISITADLGSVCVANANVAGAYVSQHVALARPNARVNSRWLAYVVSSTVGREQLLGAGYGGTKIQLSLDDIKTFIVPLPPNDEQYLISKFLDAETRKLDLLTAEHHHFEQLLQERRSALISAAVTGKIDVRDWQPPEGDSVALTVDTEAA